MSTPPTPPAPGLAAELAAEQAHVDLAYQRVETLRDAAVAQERASVRGHTGTPQGLFERDATVAAWAARRVELDAAGEGLVFGRLDRRGGQTLHVGRLGVRGEDQVPLVVDWRAPAAAAFYQASAHQPRGVIRRRTIVCRGPKVRGIDDELLDPTAADQLTGSTVIGDGAFLAAVGRERGQHMRDIVATIQAEQDAAVRAADDGALLVLGGPGTGKTAVALHRVAYLMYARRQFYARRGVLVIGPSPVFIDYVSQVLPGLGETSAQLVSVGELPRLPAGAHPGPADEPALAAVKGSARMAPLLRAALTALAEPSATAGDLEVTRWGSTITIARKDLRRARGRFLRSRRPYNTARTMFVDAAGELAWRAWSARPQEGRLEGTDRREDFADWLEDLPAWRRELDRLWPALDPAGVLTALADPELLARAGAQLLREGEAAALAASWAARRGPDGFVASPADAVLLDELTALIGPPPPPPTDEDEDEDFEAAAAAGQVLTTADRMSERGGRDSDAGRGYAHFVVDEGQDITPMQWNLLGRRAGGASWTIVGDWAQSAWPEVTEARAAMAACLGRLPVRTVTLTTNYRTSAEIAELAAGLLRRVDPQAQPPAAVRTTGWAPVLQVVPADAVPAAVVAATGAVLEQVTGTVGVICPRGRLAAVRAALADLLAEHPRLSVLDAWAVKGLEFDGCVVAGADGLAAEGLTPAAGIRSLYVACTRATQRLVVVSALPWEQLTGPDPG